MINDARERLQATDPTHSFIVQAPAGSGKTEILSQRFLRLLACVKQPEHIVALTFTRKAASEMKERILKALQIAETGIEPEAEHLKYSFNLAQDALKQDHLQGWHLLRHPNRLRIMTIDALCQRLSDAVPLFENDLPFSQVTETPNWFYESAARACLRDALTDPSLQSSIKILLNHLDNQQERLVQLLCDLLTSREQWLALIFEARYLSKEDFESALKHIEQHTLNRFVTTIPNSEQENLCSISRLIAQIENDPTQLRYALHTWTHFSQILLAQNINREYAQALADLFLTSKDTIRKGFDHRVGLTKDAILAHPDLKAKSKDLCERMNDWPLFVNLLIQVKYLPNPSYSDSQWQVLQALFTLLPILAAELHLEFKKNNCLDFTQITQQALRSLGEENNPTDLTLYLDYVIQHLLIDEFQDTSISQIRLIEKLVQNWQSDEGKTLFVVGDPMQSIYRFRQAEVGLFLKARQEGIGPVKLIPLELRCNFRSTESIIQWINQHFNMIFPPKEDIETGAISFHQSIAVLPSNSNTSWIQTQVFPSKKEEAEHIVTLLKTHLKDFPKDTIALLVRSRQQLTEVIKRLRQEHIDFDGIDIHALAGLPHLRDIWSLTKALLHPACRLSWLSVLRSPYGGFNLKDIHIIAQYDPKKSIYYAMQHCQELEALSDDGKIRLRYCYRVFEHALSSRHQHSLIEWVMNTAQNLHYPYLIETDQLIELEQFWQLIEQHTQNTTFPDVHQITKALVRLYSKQATPSKIHIMTIHKAKGLEFDTVIIPGMGNKSGLQDTPLIRWLKLPRESGNEYLLVSPIKACDEDKSPLYDFLRDLDAEKDHYELARLFYVATTRAKKRLYLFDNQDSQTQNTFRHFLPHLFQNKEQDENLAPDEANLPIMSRLPVSFYTKEPIFHSKTHNQVKPILSSRLARQIGIIAHELLQWICTHHATHIDTLPWTLIHQRCRQQGFNNAQCHSTKMWLKNQLNTFLTSDIGQWLIKPHSEEHNEYALLVKEGLSVKTRVIDRTFICEHIRWVIDFKTGVDEENQQIHHRKQVNHYAQLLASLSPEPIYGGIYYLATNRWIYWAYCAEEKKKLETRDV